MGVEPIKVWLRNVDVEEQLMVDVKHEDMEPKEFGELTEIKDYYVDHLVSDLEKRPIAKILDFLALYVGWERIYAYVYDKVAERRELK